MALELHDINGRPLEMTMTDQGYIMLSVDGVPFLTFNHEFLKTMVGGYTRWLKTKQPA